MPAMAAGAFVYAFDANSEACSGLIDNAILNDFHNYTIVNAAVGSKIESYYRLKDGWLAMGIKPSVLMDYKGAEWTELITLDTYAAGYPNWIKKLDWVKIDVEGFELDVLQGAMDILKKYHPKMIIENHTHVDHIGPWMQINGIWNKILNLLIDIGYHTRIEADYVDSGRSHLYCE